MSLIRRNIAANFSGRMVSAVVALAAVPVTIRVVGVEGYGLVGVFFSLQAVFGLLDMGLSPTINRELARMSLLPEKAQDMRNVVRSLEWVYWGMGLVVGGVVLLFADIIASHWVNAEALPTETVKRALLLMGAVLACQWPITFYQGGLAGLQHQVLLSTVETAAAVVRALGGVVVLCFVSPTVEAYFVWQIVASAATVVTMAFILWSRLPKAEQAARFELRLVKTLWKFAAGMTGISLTVFLLMQLDKLILSKLLSLKDFGYYVLAASAAGVLNRFVGPIFNAVFPRLSQLATLKAEEQVKRLYHQSCLLMSLVILPVAVVAAFFSPQLLLLWTGDDQLVAKTSLLFSVLIAGNALNGLMNIPYALQLAHGWTRLAFTVNLAAAIILVPLIFVLVNRFGAIGGALSWFALNLGYVCVTIRVMHRRLLTGSMWRWYLHDVGRPLLVALATATPFYFAMPENLTRPMLALYLGSISGIVFGVTCLSEKMVRKWTGTTLRHSIQWIRRIAKTT